MGVSSINNGMYSVLGTSGANREIDKNSGSMMNMDDFFTLLCAQLKNQSMDKPMDDTQFISQMAQFSSLQQMQDLTNQFKFTFAASLIGKNVTVIHKNEDSSKVKVSGLVDRISIEGGKTYLYIKGERYESSEVTEISVT